MGAKQLGPQPELRSQSLMTKIMLAQEPEIIDHMRTIRMGYQEPVNHMGDTVGHYAAYRSYFEVLKYLFKIGDRFQIPNTRSLTALDVALPEVREWMYKQLESRPQDQPASPTRLTGQH